MNLIHVSTARRHGRAAAVGALYLAAWAGCVAQRPLDGQPCPCAPGWTCDQAANVCTRDDGGAAAAGASGGGTTGGGLSGGGGGSAGGAGQGPVTVTDGGSGQSDVVSVGPSYVCGPADAGVRCYCGTQPFFPAPIDSMGQQQTFVLPPDPTTVKSYTTVAEFDAVAVGRWQRTAGQGELICEQFGVEFTADHRMVPLVVASDGSVEEVNALAVPFVITFGSNGPTLGENGGTSTNIAPTFFDFGQSMYLNVAPWPADYVRIP